MDESSSASPSAEPNSMQPGDRPIAGIAEDTMGRSIFARALADELLRVPVDAGYVLGLTGPWGSGKTSLINMTVDALGDAAVVVHFNPWLFSGTDALVASFFREVGKQLAHKKAVFKTVAQKMATYGRLLSPAASLVGAGSAITAASSALEGLTADPSVYEQRNHLIEELGKLDRRLVVIVDDVDRLRPNEVLDIVRLVRLVGDFPNTVYLMAFDRQRVEQCLGEGDEARGRAYLEKIVQIAFDVPAAHEVDVHTLLLDGLGRVLDTVVHGPFDREAWDNLYALVLGPLFRTPRDVRRYLQALPMTLKMVGEEVAVADVLTLEGIRVLRPEMYAAIRASTSALCDTSGHGSGYREGTSPEDGPVGALVHVDPVLARAVCTWLFPAASRHFENLNYGNDFAREWRWARRVANLSVLRFYLECRLPADVVPAQQMEAIYDALGDAETLRGLLRGLTPDQLFDAFDRLKSQYSKLKYDPDAEASADPAAIALPVLMEQLPNLPARHNGILTIYPRTVLAGACAALLSRIADEAMRDDIARLVVKNVATTSARLHVLQAVMERTTRSALISEAAYADLEQALVAEISETAIESLITDPDVLTICLFLQHARPSDNVLGRLIESDRFLIALLLSAMGQTSTQTFGAAAVTRTASLPWENFIEMFGDEQLPQRIAAVLDVVEREGIRTTEAELAALQLAQQYAAGERTNPFAD